MKKIGAVAVLLSLAILSGCTAIHKTPFPTFSNLEFQEEAIQGETMGIEAEVFKHFFERYFSLSEEELLVLNQAPASIDSDYEASYKGYRDKLLKLMGGNLTSAAKEKLNAGYRTQDFHLPKKLALNGYVTVGSGTVEAAEIVAMRVEGDHTFYKVALTTRNKVENLAQANKKYTWDAEKNYYIQKEEGSAEESIFNGQEEIPQGVETSYYYLQETPTDTEDEIKLIQYYWVEVENNSLFQIESIKEAIPIPVNEETRQSALQTKHAERIPYYLEASAVEEQRIRKVMEKLFSQKREFYAYYVKKLEADYEAFKAMWTQEMGLEKEIVIPQEDYQEAFNNSLEPYKDDLKTLKIDSSQIVITPSVYGTKKQPRFVVTVPIEAVNNRNEVVYYAYTYYVGMEFGRIESITYINRQQKEIETAAGKETGKEKEVEAEEMTPEKK